MTSTNFSYEIHIYSDHLSIFWDHSHSVPIANIAINSPRISPWGIVLGFNKIGNKRTNSTSNTRKRREIEKKWKEKNVRAGLWGMNPHSNGLLFSESLNLEKAKTQETINTIRAKEIVVASM